MGLFNRGKRKIEIIGVYAVARRPKVKLIECVMDCKPSQADVMKFLHPIDNMPKSNWQAAYDERYLNADGTEIIGSLSDPPPDAPPTRLVFFLHFVNADHPLLSPFGKLRLPPESAMPARLKKIIKYVPVD